jgi:hypothetical protein
VQRYDNILLLTNNRRIIFGKRTKQKGPKATFLLDVHYKLSERINFFEETCGEVLSFLYFCSLN